jgi:uncharacterized phage-like protein YoqJ
MIISGTGHRLGRRLADSRAPSGFEDNVWKDLILLCEAYVKRIKPSIVIIGGAIGFDMALGVAAVRLDVEMHVALPFYGHHTIWPKRWQHELQRLEGLATKVNVIAQDSAMHDAFKARNSWMVDNCSAVLALWDGLDNGGIAHTVALAKARGVPVINTWEAWKRGRIKNG